MATKVTVGLEGLSEVREYFSEKRIKKAVALGLARFTTEVHGSLRTSIHNRYTGNQNIDKQLHRGSSSVKFGQSILSTGLTYDIKNYDLSKFNYSANYGALKEGDGWVHTVEVVRGQRKVLRGKSGRGGFTTRTGSSKKLHGRAKRIFRGGAQMLERKGRKRTPLRVLYAPNTENMINRALQHDKVVKKVVADFPNNIGKLIDA